ncbi:hypothetical protein FBU30_002410 [Linnemannia zychae]|nr:hypothetical protein FBU30_002410 [Linnemannia zychae]
MKVEISNEESIWINSVEDMSAEAFFNKFVTSQQEAKDNLKLDFQTWKKSNGDQLWLNCHTRLSALRTAGPLVDASEYYEKRYLQQNA